jgi:hypothetical protein
MRIPAALNRVLERHKIDGQSLLVLVGAYVKQDVRSGNTLARLQSRDHVAFNKALLAIVGVHLLMGATLAAIPLTVEMGVYSLSLFLLTYTLFLVAMAVIVESGNALFGETEADILGHLPVTPRTLMAAKLINLFLFSMLLSGSINLLPMITGIWATGSNALFPIAHAIAFSLISLFATSIIVVSYGLLIRYVSRQRFDSIVGYAQLALLISVMFGYQLLPRFLELAGPSIEGFHRYHLLYPPAWFAGLAMIAMGKTGLWQLGLASLSLGSLIVLGILATHKIAIGYATLESAPTETMERRAETISRSGVRTGFGLWRAVKASLVRRPVERAVFDLLIVYVLRNRETKLRVYPSLAYIIFVPLIAFLSGQLRDPFSSSVGSFYVIMAGAMISFGGLTSVESLVFSDHFRAADVFRFAPVSTIGEVHRGFRKAVFVLITLPGTLVLTTIYGLAWRNLWHALILVGPWTFISAAISYLPFLFRPRLPLSRKYQKGQQSARVLLIVFVCMLLVMAIGGLQLASIHGRISFLPYWLFVLSAAAALIVAHSFVRRFSRERDPIPPFDQGADNQPAAAESY